MKHKTIQGLCSCGVMAAVICVLGPFSLPIGPVPVAFANLAIDLSVYLLGWKWGAVSCLVYLLVGLAGLPVFAGFGSGAAKLLGAHGPGGGLGDPPHPIQVAPRGGAGGGYRPVLPAGHGLVLLAGGVCCGGGPGAVRAPLRPL